jgi:hypothetical protein
MAMAKATGYRKIKASTLSKEQQKEIQKAMQGQVIEALIRSLRSSPPELDLEKTEVILQPGQDPKDFKIAANPGICGHVSATGAIRFPDKGSKMNVRAVFHEYSAELEPVDNLLPPSTAK